MAKRKHLSVIQRRKPSKNEWPEIFRFAQDDKK